MANKRQKKKQQAKMTPVTASQVSNNTNMKDAMTKAKAEVKKAPAKKPEPVKSKPEPRKIIGVGSANKGAIIHAITDRDNSILCDTRRKNYLVDVTLSPSHVNCIKCKKFKSFEKYLELKTPKKVEPVKKEPVKEAVKEVKPAKKEPVKPKVNIDIPPPGKVFSEPDEFEALKTLMDIRFKRLRTHLEKVILKKINEEIGKMPNWFITRKSNGRFQIIHEKSRYVFTDNITQEQAEQLIVRYSEIPIQWDGVTRIPKAFIGSIRKIHAEVIGNTVNKKEPKKKRKPIEKIKKRRTIGIKHFPEKQKQVRIKIKRRSK